MKPINLNQFKCIIGSTALLFSFQQSVAQSLAGDACSMTKLPPINYFINYEEGTFGLMNRDIDVMPPPVIDSCEKASGQYLMFGIALKRLSPTGKARDLIFQEQGISNGQYSCVIENSNLQKLQSRDESDENTLKQFQFLRKCLIMDVTQIDQKPLVYKENQEFCKMKRVSSSKAEARGDFCFIPVNQETRVALAAFIDPSCANEKYLADNNLQISDIEAQLNAYVVPNDTGIYTNNQIGYQSFRLVTTPSSKIMPVDLNAPINGPRFPVQFMPDIEIAKFSIKDLTKEGVERTQVDLNLLVSNLSLRSCQNGICAGPADYQAPIAGEVTFFEISDGRRREVDSWFAGNLLDPFVKAQWQGVFPFGRKIIENYQVDPKKEYELEYTFYNPTEDFILLSNRFQQLSIDPTNLNGTAGLDDIQPIDNLKPISVIQGFGGLPNLGTQTDPIKEFDKILAFFKKFSRDSIFPPTYEQICNEEKKVCIKTGRSKSYLTLSVRFDLGEVQDSDLTFKLSNLRVSKSALLGSSYKSKSVEKLPQVQCKW